MIHKINLLTSGVQSVGNVGRKLKKEDDKY